MIRKTLLGVTIGLTVILGGLAARSDWAVFDRDGSDDKPAVHKASDSYGRLPLSFEANDGQSDHTAAFLSRGSDYTLLLTGSDATLQLRNAQAAPNVVRMTLVGSNPESFGAGVDPLPGRVNYMIGRDPSKWRTDIPTYAKVRYEQVYPGVDVVYYGNQRSLEYDFIVAPGADPNRIRLGFEGANEVEINADGDLVLSTDGGPVQMHKPVIYQEANGARIEVAGAFKTLDPLSARHTAAVGFELGEYDATRPLVIDPTLVYSTYFGGSGIDQGRGIAVDGQGNVYLTGNTNSADFLKKSSLQRPFGGGTCGTGADAAPCSDAFVAKLNGAGTALLYATYLGGTGADQGNGITVDAAGNAYVIGLTSSTNFPTESPVQAAAGGGMCGAAPATAPCNDAFVAKLNPSGSKLVYSTYLGGGANENGFGITLDASGAAFVIGQTASTNFPTANAFQPATAGGNNDLFVAKLNPAGTALVYSTYLGGSGNDIGRSIAVDKAGSVYFTGLTSSTNYPTTKDAILPTLPPHNTGHGFVTKLDASGKLVSSTFLGGSDVDDGFGLVVDGGGNLYVTGDTRAKDFPTRNPAQAANGGGTFDNFVTKMRTEGLELVYSTYLGGDLTDQPKGIGIDAKGNVYITGNTNSTNFPTTNPLQAKPGGGTCGTAANPVPCNDFFVAKLNAAGTAFEYSTYLGGNGLDAPNNGSAIAVDPSGNVYIIGHSASPSFPTKNALQPASGGGAFDAIVIKIAP